MKRPLKPVLQTEAERRQERRFTRRMVLLAATGGLFGLVVNAVTHTMGRPPTPAGAPPVPSYPPPPTPTIETPPPKPPRLRGK